MSVKPGVRRLYLLRHAKSSWDDPALADHDRPLAARGLRAGELLAEHVRRVDIAPQLVLCSSSTRTRETLALLDLPGAPVVLYERGIYAASAGVLLTRVQAIRSGVDSAMLVGHSSGIEDLALILARRGDSLGQLREKFPTGGLASLAFSGDWATLDARCAKLVEFVTPRDLAGAARLRKS